MIQGIVQVSSEELRRIALRDGVHIKVRSTKVDRVSISYPPLYQAGCVGDIQLEPLAKALLFQDASEAMFLEAFNAAYDWMVKSTLSSAIAARALAMVYPGSPLNYSRSAHPLVPLVYMAFLPQWIGCPVTVTHRSIRTEVCGQTIELGPNHFKVGPRLRRLREPLALSPVDVLSNNVGRASVMRSKAAATYRALLAGMPHMAREISAVAAAAYHGDCVHAFTSNFDVEYTRRLEIPNAGIWERGRHLISMSKRMPWDQLHRLLDGVVSHSDFILAFEPRSRWTSRSYSLGTKEKHQLALVSLEARASNSTRFSPTEVAQVHQAHQLVNFQNLLR